MLNPLYVIATAAIGTDGYYVEPAIELQVFRVLCQIGRCCTFDAALLLYAHAGLSRAVAVRLPIADFYKNQAGRGLQHNKINLTPTAVEIAIY